MGRTYITESNINIEAELSSVLKVSREIGAVVTFRGIIRGSSNGKEIEKLYYDYYPEMVEKSLRDMRDQAISHFGIIDATIIHRVGEVKVGELALLVITVAKHRKEAFNAAQWIMDEIKKSAAIWKKGIFKEGGEAWIGVGAEERNH